MVAEKFIRAVKWPLSRILGGIRYVEKFLGPDDDWIEDDRRHIYEWADKVGRPLGRPTITEKGSNEWTYTVDVSPDRVEKAIHPKYQRNLLSTRKYRTFAGSGRQWAVGSYAYDPIDKPWQHHVYLFPGTWGGTEIYAHKETSVRDPVGHVTNDQVSGDPDNTLAFELEEASIDYQTEITHG